MKALTYTQYGGPDVVRITDVTMPEPQDGEVLIRVHASAVTTGDWRLRAAAFPGALAIPGRLMFGLRRPKKSQLGTVFAGTVEAIGVNTTRFYVGDRVYGMSLDGGASAEYLAFDEAGAIAKMPETLDFAEAAALPFGAVCALVFLTDFSSLHAGQRVLVVGASGGVGTYGVQIAKAIGAHVTGVASGSNAAFVRSLGADAFVDYRVTDIAKLTDRFDIIFDTVGALSTRAARGLLEKNGQFLPLNFGLRELGAALLNPLRLKKIRIAVNGDKAEDLERVNTMIKAGTLRPVIDTIYPLSEARAAHAQVESRHARGTVVLKIPSPEPRAAA